MRRRRRASIGLVAAVLIAAAAFVAGCNIQEQAEPGPEEQDSLIYSFNNGDDTVSIVNTDNDEVVKTVQTQAKARYPSNQYAPEHGLVLADNSAGSLPPDIGGVSGKSGVVSIFDQRGNHVLGNVYMPHATAIWQGITPDGEVGVIVKRPPDVVIFVNTDRDSENFGKVIGEVPVPNFPGLCDMTIGPNSEYAYVPDIHANQVRVIDIQEQETVATVPDPTEAPTWMATASWDGKWLTVENNSDPGAETIYDISDPENPEHVKTLTQEDGLGRGPYTSEFTPDNERVFITMRLSSSVSVVDMDSMEIVKDISLDEGKQAGVVGGAFNADGSKFYVAMQNKNAVAVIDTNTLDVIKTVEVGPKPAGITGNGYDWVEPTQATFSLDGILGTLGLDGVAEKLD